jgi:hypothetical protein
LWHPSRHLPSPTAEVEWSFLILPLHSVWLA